MMVTDEHARVRGLAKAPVDPGVMLAPDLTLIQIRLRRIDLHQRELRPVRGPQAKN